MLEPRHVSLELIVECTSLIQHSERGLGLAGQSQPKLLRLILAHDTTGRFRHIVKDNGFRLEIRQQSFRATFATDP